MRGTPVVEAQAGRRGAQVVAGLALYVLAVLVMWALGPWALLALTMTFVAVSVLGWRQARRAVADGTLDVERLPYAEVVRRTEWRLARSGAAASALLLPVAALGHHWSWIPAVLCTIHATVWVERRSPLARAKRAAGLPRLLGKTSRLREQAESIAVAHGASADPVVAPDGVPGPSLLVYVAFVGAVVACAAVLVGDPDIKVRTDQSIRLASFFVVDRVFGDPELPSPSPSPSGSPPPSSSPTATARPMCTPAEAQERFRAALPAAERATADKLYAEWYDVGAGAGCPPKGARGAQRGTLWVVSLAGGPGGKGLVIGDSAAAAVVLADFATLVGSKAAELASVDERMRWGHGSAQVERYPDRTCRLLWTRDHQSPIDLPKAVTVLVLDFAARAGAFPRIDDTGAPNGLVSYDIAFVVPATTTTGVAVRARLTFTYDARSHLATSPSGRARDTDPCGGSPERLRDRAKELDASVHAAKERKSATPLPSP